MTFREFPNTFRQRVVAGWRETRAWVASPRREIPAFVLQPTKMTDLPIDLASIGAAIVLTVLLMAGLNAWATRAIHRAYLEHVPEPLVGATSPAAATDRLIERGWAAATDRDWLVEAIQPGRPTSTLILDVGRYLATTDQAETPAAAELRRLALGDPQGDLLPPSGLWRTVSGKELLDTLLAADPLWRRALESDVSGLADSKRAFLGKLCDDMVSATRPPIRNIRRWNGTCQWCTLALTWFCLITLTRRAWLLRTLRRSPSVTDPQLDSIPQLLRTNRDAGASPPEQTMLLQEESNRLGSAIEGRVYDLLGFLNGCLPSLGFIGTVVGMGEALLLADSLFGASDRQKIISLMTEQLGLAFDTTLVALLCGLVVGVAIASVRRAEQEYLSQFEENLVDQFVRATGAVGGTSA